MTRRFPTLLSRLAITLAVATGCTPGMLTLAPAGNGAITAATDQPAMPSDADLARNVSVVDVRPIAGVATLKSTPAVKLAVTEMTQTLQEFYAFEADSKAVDATFTVAGFTLAAKGGNSDHDKSEKKDNAKQGGHEGGDGDDHRDDGKRPTPFSSATCVVASDGGTTPASDVPAQPATTSSDTGATASDTSPVPSVAPACPPVTNEKTKTTVINADGSRTRTMTRTRLLPGGGGMTESMTRTVGKSPRFMSFQHVRDMTLPNGAKRHQARDQQMNADGSGTVTVTMSFTRTDGKTRSLTMTTTIAADGTKTRTGTLTRFDGTTVTIASKGTQVTVTDPATDTTVTTGETPTGTTGTVDVTVGGTPVGTVDTTTPTDPSPAPSASAVVAEPTAAPSPVAEPTAAPSPVAEPTAAPSPVAEPTAAPEPTPSPSAVASV